MSVICDGCGTDRDVIRAYITVWNGNVLDVCRVCATARREVAKSLVEMLDELWAGPASRRADGGGRDVPGVP